MMGTRSKHSREPFPSPCGTCWLVPLQRDGLYAMVSEESVERVKIACWFAGKDGYANGSILYADKTRRTVFMHRYVYKGIIAKGFLVDHINGNKLDNRLPNLRVVTPRQNAVNRICTSRSGYRNVWTKDNSMWTFKISAFGREYAEYGFLTAEEAAFARDKLVLRLGTGAPLNFPERFTDTVQDTTAPAVNLPGPQQMSMF